MAIIVDVMFHNRPEVIEPNRIHGVIITTATEKRMPF
jgi:hypothetical protein